MVPAKFWPFVIDHKFVIVKKRFETGLVLQPILSPLMTHARFLDNRPPVPLRSLRFARFLSTGGDNMTSPENYGAVAPLTYNSKRKIVGGGTRENRASGCSDRCFLGSKIPEHI